MADADILGPSDRRRIQSLGEKAALLAEVDAEGGKVRLLDPIVAAKQALDRITAIYATPADRCRSSWR